ncbi:MAG: DNA-3-methyladenine glycosylase I [Chloroflexota bacterium]|nr:MAG: DNA-3-methyladenine glycosylase I [Chloroflexota bacterium]
MDFDDGRPRCAWAGNDALMRAYHDDEWGRPCHDDRELFERLMLECFQAGLSWQTILRKREAFRRAFEGWDVERIAGYGDDDRARLMGDAGIVRNRLKVAAATKNALAFLAIRAEFGTFDAYVWSFAPNPNGRARRQALGELPAATPESDALSRDLRRRGFTFVGSTIVYAFMQSVGIVDDHLAGCFRVR